VDRVKANSEATLLIIPVRDCWRGGGVGTEEKGVKGAEEKVGWGGGGAD
jgi:hypothetical protein